ncbi:hypothetical protein OHA72_28375 [Dactylosporangium sp. NBC_01737]|uniref:hypothetical protein n=1 Tax=Dactylosporangium sp. NBC_01737 TaxID=2975959 RepID=UPI002E0F19DF|nr:hypothetical protein OHA72_28375 [Dactylosporangium sp. NBC_01737]
MTRNFVAWNQAAFDVLGGGVARAPAGDELAALERWVGGGLPGAVREWFLLGGDRLLASVSSNLVTGVQDLAGRFLEHGFLLLETDSQACCRWVVPVSAAYDDPPVYLIDPDDDACATRSRYAGCFSDYTFTAAWDATLWKAEVSADFDHPLPPDALDGLRRRLTVLPTTHGWAMNQSCDAVHRFGGPARVAVAVAGGTALWSAVAAASPGVRDAFAALIGAGSGG